LQHVTQALTKELLDYLRVCDLEFKPDLTAKVCQLIQRYSPERRWYIDSMLQVRARSAELYPEGTGAKCFQLPVRFTGGPLAQRRYQQSKTMSPPCCEWQLEVKPQ